MAEEAGAPKKSIDLTLIVVLLNTLLMLGAAGFLFYSRVLYKRPVITESSERARLATAKASPRPDGVSGYVPFEPMTINIESVPTQPRTAEGTDRMLEGKLHYVTMAFTLQIRDMEKKGLIENLRPLITDRVISLLGRRSFRELTTVQGRYLLRTQLIDDVNSMLVRKMPEAHAEGLVTNLFFTRFEVQ